MSAWTPTMPVADELMGDIRPLLEQIGSLPNGSLLAGAGKTLAQVRAKSAADLQSLVREYQQQILQPLELPAIQRAFQHASRNELRELIACDAQLSAEPALQTFAAASRQIGQNQLQRLRPLRDHRLAQRYLAAVEQKQAGGWHTLVYGLTLAIYSVPLRPGLLGYAQQTTRGFVLAASRALKLTEGETQSVLAETTVHLPASVETLLGQSVLT